MKKIYKNTLNFTLLIIWIIQNIPESIPTLFNRISDFNLTRTHSINKIHKKSKEMGTFFKDIVKWTDSWKCQCLMI